MNIDDEHHDPLRKASAVSCLSINAQTGLWIRIGKRDEMNPTQSFNEIVTREMQAAGVVIAGPRKAAPYDQAP